MIKGDLYRTFTKHSSELHAHYAGEPYLTQHVSAVVDR